MKEIVCALILLINLTANFVYAEEPKPKPIFPIESAEYKMLKEVTVHWFSIKRYKQPLEIKTIDRSEAKYDTPEDAFISFVSALKSMSYGWFLTNYDQESRKLEEDKVDKDKERVNKFKKAWEEMFSNAQFFLLSRVDRENDVLLEYIAKTPGKPDDRGILSFRNEHGKWKRSNFTAPYGVITHYLETGEDTYLIPGD